MAIIVSKNGKNATKIDTSEFEAEGYLQQYIYDNPESVPLYDIKDDIRLLVACREFPTNSGPIDVLGFDQDGEIYCVETKLYKNPDKRLVVAQVLDYGASLWNSSPDFSEFTEIIDRYLGKANGCNLSRRIAEFFQVGDEETAVLLDNVRANLARGRFKFIVLMDKLHDQLKNLVVFLNENSQFDIYAVEVEFYRYEEHEILIPKLFGAEVKKELVSHQSTRKKWDQPTFFEAAAQVLEPDCLEAVTELFRFSEQRGASIGWGTGKTKGSFSPRFPTFAQKSIFSVYSDGKLILNFGWLCDDEATRERRDRLAEALSRQAGIVLPDNYRDTYVSIERQDWCPKAKRIVAVLESVLSPNHP